MGVDVGAIEGTDGNVGAIVGANESAIVGTFNGCILGAVDIYMEILMEQLVQLMLHYL